MPEGVPHPQWDSDPAGAGSYHRTALTITGPAPAFPASGFRGPVRYGLPRPGKLTLVKKPQFAGILPHSFRQTRHLPSPLPQLIADCGTQLASVCPRPTWQNSSSKTVMCNSLAAGGLDISQTSGSGTREIRFGKQIARNFIAAAESN